LAWKWHRAARSDGTVNDAVVSDGKGGNIGPLMTFVRTGLAKLNSRDENRQPPSG
jgi:hypothetical protein